MKFPQQVQDVLSAGSWSDPGPEALNKLLGLEEGDSDLVLFASREMMERIKDDLDGGGYVDDPEFCMVRNQRDRAGSADPRLVYADTVFVGGAKFPGDDVFLAIDTSKPEHDQHVLWFDWSRPAPERWTPLVSVAVFVKRLAELIAERQAPSR
ncbi:hypothetical protein G6O69_28525 [Pseudenhygromyxa sp. WMMC2535]|uniref:hypothetical protein n=1 Tax=Pseudenhygromyxa sp. WMMC2535 TaxID=2712867 RepID=UPI0015560FC8|nr:hypothetical protein [Pseudenhygromyxa sp. WMMC2535]NVB41812.1 hypothetical protein [Pseudenhygromyxa sp. WMMC2535]